MATFFSMPKLGLDMTHGIIVSWLAEEGDSVEEGIPILEVETDKATQEVESPVSGILAKIIRYEGEEVPCNYVIGIITEPGEEIPAEIPVEISENTISNPVISADIASPPVKSNADAKEDQPQKRIRISPTARKLADELGVDISKIIPKGKQIMRDDVETAYRMVQSSGPSTSGASVNKKPISTIRQKIAEHMDKSARTVARVGLALEVDATKLSAARSNSEVEGAKISYNILLAKQVAAALTEFPYMNAQLHGEEIWEYTEANIGIAVDTSRGLLVPVIKNVCSKNIEQLQKEFTALATRAVEGKSTLADLEGGTFTITNLGILDIESFLPVINLPECAILGVGAIIEKPVVENHSVVIQPRINLTLAFDHRLVDGAPAAKFLQRLKVLIEEMPN